MFNSSNPDPSVTSSRVKATGCQLDPGMRPISGGARTDQGQQMEKPREKRDEEQINGEWKARGWGGGCLEQQICSDWLLETPR